jgi:hypothetical protein
MGSPDKPICRNCKPTIKTDLCYHLVHMKTGTEDIASIDLDVIRPISIGYIDPEEIPKPGDETIEWSGTCKVCDENLSFRLFNASDTKNKIIKMSIIDVAGAIALIPVAYIVKAIFYSISGSRETLFIDIILAPIFFGLLIDAFRRIKILLTKNTNFIDNRKKDNRHNLINEIDLDNKPTDGLTDRVFSPDKKRNALCAKLNGKWYMIIDGHKHGPYEAVGKDMPIFSQNGQRVVWYFKEAGKWFMAVDGKQEGPYDDIFPSTIVLDSTGRRIMYGVKNGNDYYMMVDGQKYGPYEGIGEDLQKFSQDSHHATWGVTESGKWFLIVDGKREGPYDGIAPGIAFDNTGKRIAYAMREGNVWNVIVDYQKYGPYNLILEGTPQFSADGTQVVWGDKRNENWFIQRMSNSNVNSEGPYASCTAAKEALKL